MFRERKNLSKVIISNLLAWVAGWRVTKILKSTTRLSSSVSRYAKLGAYQPLDGPRTTRRTPYYSYTLHHYKYFLNQYDFRPRSHTKNTPPISPVTIPIGMSSGDIAIRAAISTQSKKS